MAMLYRADGVHKCSPFENALECLSAGHPVLVRQGVRLVKSFMKEGTTQMISCYAVPRT
jgi:hypothetical protein